MGDASQYEGWQCVARKLAPRKLFDEAEEEATPAPKRNGRSATKVGDAEEEPQAHLNMEPRGTNARFCGPLQRKAEGQRMAFSAQLEDLTPKDENPACEVSLRLRMRDEAAAELAQTMPTFPSPHIAAVHLEARWGTLCRLPRIPMRCALPEIPPPRTIDRGPSSYPCRRSSPPFDPNAPRQPCRGLLCRTFRLGKGMRRMPHVGL